MSHSPAAASTGTTSTSCESCGWIAAFCAALAFGSFGVPIKSNAAKQVDVDPLVFQTYKTVMCFLTTGLFLGVWSLVRNDRSHSELLTFSPWGIVSGLFWVPGGVATVYAVKSAGLALGVGIGSSFIVLVSFVWGIFIFHEPVHSQFGACAAILCMMTGLFGMSYYSAPIEPPMRVGLDDEDSNDDRDTNAAVSLENLNRHCHDRRHTALALAEINDSEINDSGSEIEPIAVQERRRRRRHSRIKYMGLSSENAQVDVQEEDFQQQQEQQKNMERPVDSHHPTSVRHDDSHSSKTPDRSSSPSECSSGEDALSSLHSSSCTADHPYSCDLTPEPLHASIVICGGRKLTKRQTGMLSALFCGVWGGSITAPMAWAPPSTRGLHYLLSFAIGASIVNLVMWVFRYFWYMYWHQDNFVSAYQRLPSFHVRVLWIPGGISGLLWSIGNLFSLVSVAELGEGVGYPLVQTSILISGLWGLLYFHEVTGTERRSKWFASSLLTIFGILLLSYEHHDA